MVSISIDREFEFGKYCGLKVGEIIKKDLQYVEYLNSKIPWIFTDIEKQTMRNLRNNLSNYDILQTNVKHRSRLEEEIYGLIHK